MPTFSPLHRFAEWPNSEIPAVAAGVYAIWEAETLIYCGISGRELEKASDKQRYGLVTRLHSHANGRLSGDQFCVWVANRLEYQFAIVESSGEAFSLERQCR